MKYWRLLQSLLLIYSISIVDGSIVKAKANSENKSDRILQILHQVKNQTLDLTFKKNYVSNQIPSKTNVSETSLAETPKQEPESKPKQLCPIAKNSVVNRIPPIVGNVTIRGSSIFDQKDFAEAAKKLDSQNLAFPKQLAEAIIKLYLDKGYITSTAVVNPEKKDEIKVIEGQIKEITVDGNQRLSKSYICNRILLGIGIPLNTNQLEDQLKILRTDPLFKNVEATLIPSGEDGLSNLQIVVQEANSFNSSFTIDNNSPPSVGSERIGVDLNYRNLTGIGDEITGSYYRSLTGGSEVLSFTYQVAINAKNGTLTLRTTFDQNNITQSPFDELGIRGNQQAYEISYRQPLVRNPTEEFALSLGFAFQEGQTFIFNELPNPFGIGPDADGVSRTSVIKFSQDYTKRDPQGAWSVRSQFNFGIGLFNATINESPIPDGNFFSWIGQVQRVQRLSENHLLLILADLQLTPDSLLPSQQFVMGGSQSVRGYRQNSRFGDNGFRLSIEDRITLQRDASAAPTIQLIPFVDLGAVWNKSDNPNKLPEQTFIASGGLGLLWNQPLGIDGLSLRIDYGLPFINLSDKGNNLQDDGLYFSLRYRP
ncbi:MULTISPECIES: ShlB/FhaC/HecB family hemolysin secretion/activation protein [Calothrix]|uniref:ShlB/FhaC/HecB family hemolysin secretion/activation protein n=2 Tax=Calothrix TaxID=1186 RepID=A0ABR8AIU3_9CYAN|nr:MULTISPECIES: ShlB/FhaC/HecB family hemolysin secretion/activation protein [Calothrix]MBD2199970.1 ShlB/FhaC/HecB family hemolysin secretion/activation protein [Calothrix parietina FACHB-288]MBD2228863.1 ShlB/FhaC/HecB family hemolysin secretion/activation protein [Calothrix anomala FACHB-343]